VYFVVTLLPTASNARLPNSSYSRRSRYGYRHVNAVPLVTPPPAP
jgi:hypothetical protein